MDKMDKKTLWVQMISSGFCGRFGITLDTLGIGWSNEWTFDDIIVKGCNL